jgi:LysM repeat protein
VPTVTSEPYVNPIITSTPAADGTIIHIVQYGQTLYGIAEIYGISITDLLNLNGLTEDSVIYPDEQLLIVQGTGETPTPTATIEELLPTATPTQESTPTVAPTQVQATPTPTEEPRSGGNFLTNLFSGDTLWVGIGLVAVSVFGIALLLFTSSRLK